MTKINFVATPNFIEASITVNDDVQDIEIREFTINDVDFQTPLIASLQNKEDTITSYILYTRIRLISCVYIAGTNKRLWSNLEAFEQCNYPSKLVEGLLEVVNELNPLPVLDNKEDLEAKKK